jgi:hypothetical protein
MRVLEPTARAAETTEAFHTNRRRVIIAGQVYRHAHAGVKPPFDSGRETAFVTIQRDSSGDLQHFIRANELNSPSNSARYE